MSRSKHRPFNIKKRYVAYFLIFVIAMYVILPKLGILKQSLPLLRYVSPWLVLAAVLATTISYFAAAGVYYDLALKPLKFGRTLFMQIAGMFANRLLPAGIGGMGINYLYLRKSKHNRLQATAVVTTNNTIGLGGHLLLTTILVTILPVNLPVNHFNLSITTILSIVLTAIAAGILLSVLPRVRQKISAFFIGLWKQLASYKRRPQRLLFALICSILLTLANVSCLWMSVLAVHVSIGIVPIILIFTFGLIIGTATPTPGSLGGIEAGLTAGLVSYHISLTSALSAVLLFRLISYWLPLVIGSGAFLLAKKRNYF